MESKESANKHDPKQVSKQEGTQEITEIYLQKYRKMSSRAINDTDVICVFQKQID